MRVRIVLGVALALVGVGVVLALSQDGRRLAGTSFAVQSTFTVVVPPHAIACQRDTVLADDSAAAEVLVGTYSRPRPPLTLTFTSADGAVVARGSDAGGGGQGRVTIPLAGVVDGGHTVRACVRNDGEHQVALAGAVASPDTAAAIDGRPTAGIVGFRYMRAGSESWWSIVPVIAQRFGLGKASLFGTWTLVLVALVLAGLWVAVVRLLLREAP